MISQFTYYWPLDQGGHKLIREITSAARLGGGEGLDLESITYEGYGVGCDLGTSGSDDLEM